MQHVRVRKFIDGWLNDLSIKRKLILVYVVCMIIPLVLTDGIVFSLLGRNERREEEYRMKSVADSVQYLVNSSFDEAISIINKIYLEEDVYKFLNEDFESDYDFFEKRFNFNKDIIKPLDGGRESAISNIILCADNTGIVNGGNFYNIKDLKYISWEDMLASKSSIVVFFYYPVEDIKTGSNKKRVSVIRMLDNYAWYDRNMMVYVDLDYSVLQRKMKAMTYEYPVLLCEGDRILLSSPLQKSINMDYDILGDDAPIGLEVPWNIYGRNFRILVMKNESNFNQLFKDYAPIIMLLLALNLVAPLILIRLINRSFAGRLYRLAEAFDKAELDNLRGIDANNSGADEIGSLMRGYNRMAERLNSLIQTNYRGKLERQDMELARQNAELSALHSQINPHFLFNILESIRMRSVLKGEAETAGMIEKMATLVRQNISWSTDNSTIAEELDFIRSYLELQRYRFGDRLNFDIQLADGCGSYHIPRLTLTTFVENSCVHGMEGKTTSCWVYVRVYKDDPAEDASGPDKEGNLIMEIEDTGSGMSDEDVAYLNDKMNNCTIDDIKNGSHVGMLNACLRLRMIAGGEVHFEVESEKEVGTYITITVPAGRLSDKCLK